MTPSIAQSKKSDDRTLSPSELCPDFFVLPTTLMRVGIVLLDGEDLYNKYVEALRDGQIDSSGYVGFNNQQAMKSIQMKFLNKPCINISDFTIQIVPNALITWELITEDLDIQDKYFYFNVTLDEINFLDNANLPYLFWGGPTQSFDKTALFINTTNPVDPTDITKRFYNSAIYPKFLSYEVKFTVTMDVPSDQGGTKTITLKIKFDPMIQTRKDPPQPDSSPVN